MHVPIPDWNTQRRDYWIMRYCRGISNITVFLAGPILLVGVTRILPLTLAVGLVILLFGHGLTRGRYLPIGSFKAIFTPSNWSKSERFVYCSYLLMLGWMALSLLWSPLPEYGIRDIFLLLIFLPTVQFIAIEQATNSNREFAGTLVGGLLAASLLLVLEMQGITNFLKLASDRSFNSDLNRNAVLITMLCWTPILFLKYKWPDLFVYILGIVAAGIAIFSSNSESAKIGFIVGLMVGLLLKVAPKSARVIALLLALTVLTFPFVLPKVSRFLPTDTQIAKLGHAHHRIAIWLGYSNVVIEHPIIGSGIRADRYLGLNAMAPPADPDGLYAKETTNPHNFILETWVNFGVIGAIIFSLIILGLERLTRDFKPDQIIVSMQLIVTAYIYSSFGSSVLQGWWVTTVAMAMIVVVVACRQFEEQNKV